MAAYELPDLPYDYGALEPHYGARLLEPHHGTHHRQYVEQANAAVEQLAALRADGELDAGYVGVQHMLSFALSGHILHSLFWECMSPDGGGRPQGELAAAIEESFGSFDAMRTHLAAAATSARGSGWGALVWEPTAGALAVLSIHDHEANHVPGAVPLVVIDGWEHAFYVQYGADKAAYLEGFFAVADWAGAARRFGHARQRALAPTAS